MDSNKGDFYLRESEQGDVKTKPLDDFLVALLLCKSG